jgi:hypothetical protein
VGNRLKIPTFQFALQQLKLFLIYGLALRLVPVFRLSISFKIMKGVGIKVAEKAKDPLATAQIITIKGKG